MSISNQPRALTGLAAMLLGLQVLAHHSGAMFDDDKSVTLMEELWMFQFVVLPEETLLVFENGSDGQPVVGNGSGRTKLFELVKVRVRML